MADYGTDISTLPDLDPSFALLSGQRVVGEAVARRLVTPRGSLVGAPHYGTDVRLYLGEPMTSAVLARCKTDVEREARQDERVFSAQAKVSFDSTTGVLLISMTLATADGPFQLVLAVTAVTLSILSLG